MKVDELMTKSVVTLNVGDTVEKAATLMKEHNVGSIPVCEGNTIKGIITDRDITLKAVAVGKDSKTQTVNEIMTTNIITGNPNMSIDEATKIMSENQIRRLTIVDNNNLVGIIALGDLATENNSDEMAGSALSSISQGTK
ncbi:CBS domain-containing protein [Clostridium gasigenes]|uniref:CBS domain-containing protein n=2 Tax=Clostridium gasigenes TaxID=94869 RepID=UPI0016244CFC|nr:CBS domain-containing protein [Clostridium gasigenes]MBB6623595.1 CBS domain-containing protein [Clostridium gasigenes]MBU3087604.1 CBS domain-containing protein [Clostridium gasigenes]MBU3105407.1 CBS domain-containing protein [Clostridium gasigenes]MBU3106862.1 CBS domain-containing protein [Clostridium gasigenes]MBU3131807.1 CBS domain-containing protein [Clostridium gasigenes]